MMFFATIVIMACSFGPGGCGNQPGNAVRPRDVAAMNKYYTCMNGPDGTTRSHLEADLLCAKRAGISKMVWAEDVGYHGPFVDLNGKAIIVHSKLVVQTPSPASIASEKKFTIQNAQQAINGTPIAKLFPSLVEGLFQRRGVTDVSTAQRPKPMPIRPSALKSLELSSNVFQEPKLSSVTNIFRDQKITKDDELAGTLDVWNDHLYPPSTRAGYTGDIVGFWESVGEGSEQGFIAYPQSDVAAFMDFMKYTTQIPRSGTAFATLRGFDQIPSQFKLTRNGMTEINFASSPSGCGESELVVVDSKTHRIMAEVQSAGC